VKSANTVLLALSCFFGIMDLGDATATPAYFLVVGKVLNFTKAAARLRVRDRH
jgi:hypothetical protein